MGFNGNALEQTVVFGPKGGVTVVVGEYDKQEEKIDKKK